MFFNQIKTYSYIEQLSLKNDIVCVSLVNVITCLNLIREPNLLDDFNSYIYMMTEFNIFFNKNSIN